MADAQSKPKWWEAPWQFLVHAIAGTFIFAVIASPAVALDFLVNYLSIQGVNIAIIYGLKIAEYALFAVDVALFLVFIFKTAYRTFWRL